MNKPVYLGLSILDTSKTLTYEFWCDYIKPNYSDKGNVCIQSLIINHFIFINIFVAFFY